MGRRCGRARTAALGLAALATMLGGGGCPLTHGPYPSVEAACASAVDCFSGEQCSDAGRCVLEQRDAGPWPCDPEFGRTYVVNTAAFLPEDEGDDLDGDGQLDNALGRLASLANKGWAEAIATGNSIVLFDVVGWSDPPTADDADIGVVAYVGTDADRPPDPENNLTGAGEFLVTRDQFEVTCEPVGRSGWAVLENRELRFGAPRWRIVIGGVGTVEVLDARATFVFDGTFVGFAATASGIVTACGLSRAPFPGSTTGTVLDALVNLMHMDPDIDRDGDGLESFTGDGVSVTGCTDGDGTVIEGRDCPCDPSIQDGYSTAMSATAVRAHIVGVADAP